MLGPGAWDYVAKRQSDIIRKNIKIYKKVLNYFILKVQEISFLIAWAHFW